MRRVARTRGLPVSRPRPEYQEIGGSLSDTVAEFLRLRRPFLDALSVLAYRRLDAVKAADLLAEADAAVDRLLMALALGQTPNT